MLSLLLDEQISPQVATAVLALNTEVPIVSLSDWRGGALAGADKVLVLKGAAEEALTLVTYDLKAVAPILVERGISGRSHGGVILVDNLSISPAAFGDLARALLLCWEEQGARDWSDRIVFLKPA